MNCPNCGAEASEGAKFCESCGQKLPIEQEAAPQPEPTYEEPTSQPIYQQPSYNAGAGAGAAGAAVPYPRSSGDNNLLLIAFIFNIVCTVCACWLILPLAWMIPMTVVSYGIWKGKRRNTVAFGVCTLIFVSIISGVLMLVCNKDE